MAVQNLFKTASRLPASGAIVYLLTSKYIWEYILKRYVGYP